MNRRDFMKVLGIGAVATTVPVGAAAKVAPTVAEFYLENNVHPMKTLGELGSRFVQTGWIEYTGHIVVDMSIAARTKKQLEADGWIISSEVAAVNEEVVTATLDIITMDAEVWRKYAEGEIRV